MGGKGSIGGARFQPKQQEEDGSSHSSNPRVLISGAGNETGKAVARTLDAFGAELFLCDYDGSALKDVARELGAWSRFCDAISDHSVTIFRSQLEQVTDAIDILVNVAGTGVIRALGMKAMSAAFMPLLRRGKGQRFIFNLGPGKPDPGAKIFSYASSERNFRRLAGAVRQGAHGSGVRVVQIVDTGEQGWPLEEAITQLMDHLKQEPPGFEHKRRAGR